MATDDSWGLLGTLPFSAAPVRIDGIENARTFDVAGQHACAVTDTAVRCWGESVEGSVGRVGEDACLGGPCQLEPVDVAGIDPDDVAEVVLGGFTDGLQIPGFSCARLIDGRISCWGGNVLGQLGDGTTTSRPTPDFVHGIDDAVALDASSLGTLCALRATGQLACWGVDVGGTLGTTAPLETCASIGECATRPVMMTTLRDVTVHANALARTCAATLDGSVWCWGGEGSAERLPDAGPVPRSPLVGVAFPSELDSGLNGTCARVADNVLCWGNGNGDRLVAAGTQESGARANIVRFVAGL